MKLYIPQNPKNHRISTYLTAEEIADLSKIVPAEETISSWLRDIVLREIYAKSGENE